eukprot:TRINITY_DN5660_c0_g4_i1.p1 TRINITY_DN5660_c0_g4~~TRINITY_DN5660_c0_g4_i1.p1  ORF type:complete len:229 (-),score=65.26 TRINITY_DN5660_c0_g4_i1:209-895(-)
MSMSASTGNLGATGGSTSAVEPLPKVPACLSVNSLTKRRKLPKSTGNLHAYMAEDYSQLNWPLPKMFGNEKYGYSLIDVEVKGRQASRDTRFVKECAFNSKKLVRLAYDQQIVDREWRNTYKALLRAEHHQATLPANATEKTKKILKEDVEAKMKYLLELQEQRDMYEEQIKRVYDRCDAVKETIRKEAELDELREFMEGQTRSKINSDSPFWRTKFNVHSQQVPGKK